MVMKIMQKKISIGENFDSKYSGKQSMRIPSDLLLLLNQIDFLLLLNQTDFLLLLNQILEYQENLPAEASKHESPDDETKSFEICERSEGLYQLLRNANTLENSPNGCLYVKTSPQKDSRLGPSFQEADFMAFPNILDKLTDDAKVPNKSIYLLSKNVIYQWKKIAS